MTPTSCFLAEKGHICIARDHISMWFPPGWEGKIAGTLKIEDQIMIRPNAWDGMALLVVALVVLLLIAPDPPTRSATPPRGNGVKTLGSPA